MSAGLFPDPDDLERACCSEERVTQDHFTHYDRLFLGSCRIQAAPQVVIMAGFPDWLRRGFDR